MRPVMIPDELVQPGTVRRIIAAPDGDLTNDEIRPVESLISRGPSNVAQLSMMLELEDGELEHLQSGGKIWLTMLGAVSPFDVVVLDEGQVPG
jgi:hypothetical protein